MLQLCTYHSRFACVSKVVIGALLTLIATTSSATAQILIGDPFITSYQNWIDPVPARGGNWRISLHNPTMMETSDIVPAGSNPPAEENNGSYNPALLIQDAFTSPAAYDLRARMYSSDDDGFGLVFGYQNPDNYFRAFLRWQSPGNLGGTPGVSVQKVVNGVATQISPVGTGLGNVLAPTVDQISQRMPIDVRVAVNGQNYEVYVTGINNDMPLASGMDAELMPGKIGIQSWAQRVGPAATFGRVPHWGTEVETVSVMQGANTLYSGSFNALPVSWRQVVMTNAEGATTLTTAAGEDIGNFGADINDNWIYHQTNGFENATPTAPNVDFISPAVVVNDSGATAFSNYQMQVRMGSADNDVYGVLVRVQDDNNFYRVSFHNDAAAISTTRPPRGMSVQKVRNGVWTELYRDDQNNIPFLPPLLAGTNPNTGLPMFDVSVGAVGNSLKVQVRDPNGNVINYPLITDNSDPILTGTVGFHDWGSENTYYMGYAGQDGAPLLSALSAFTDFDVTINRATGNISLTNNGAASVGIKGVSILSDGGGLNPATWTSIANNYDEPPGNGSVDPDDPWTIVTSTDSNLTEKEQSGGNGGSVNVGQTINLGNAWRKSRIEDVFVQLELASGSLVSAAVAYSGTPISRSDLNVDGVVTAADWTLYYPNLLADLGSLTDVGRALAGDLDGDGDNDVNDFSLFKADFDATNGAGAFNAMLAGVPEPSTFVLLFIGGIGTLLVRSRRASGIRLFAVVLSVSAAAGLASSASATPVDFTTFTTERFTPTTFPAPVWTLTPSSATINPNGDSNVLYSPDSALNKRFLGRLNAGADDDVVGFLLGFEPGDGILGSSADYLLLDWKGVDQTFNFEDGDVINFFHSATPGGLMPVGLALSRVTGSPTSDELWQHADLPENSFGGVEQLARGATLGSTPYNRAGSSHLFDIRYSATNVTVLVDGVEQFNQNGSFPDGRFGLYTAYQGDVQPPPTYSNFEVLPIDFVGLSATVDRGNGNITIRNAGNTPVEFDYYEINSPSGSLNVSGWNSLHDQDFQSAGPGDHQKWQEAGGSGPAALAEAFLQGSSTLAANASVDIGNAYNNSLNGEDLELTFRLPSGLILLGGVSYVGVGPTLMGDYNGNGAVDAADYVVWRKTDGSNQAGYNTWRTNFGRTAGSGSSLANSASVPEPVTWSLVGMALLVAACRGRRMTE
jgi:hypothetical protein